MGRLVPVVLAITVFVSRVAKMHRHGIQILLRYIVLMLFSGGLLHPAISTAANEQPMTAAQGEAILKELRSIRLLLEKQGNLPRGSATAKPQQQKPVQVTISGQPVLGSQDAELVLVEFSDYQCPYCRRFHLNTFPRIRKNYIDTGRLRYVAMDLPLSFHANAKTAANAAHCAGDQGKFWELRHLLIENAAKLTRVDIESYAAQLQIDMPLFRQCLNEETHQPGIDKDMLSAEKAGISGTPSFVLGRDAGTTAVKGKKLVGAQPYASFELLIEGLLKKNKQPDKSLNMKSQRFQLKSKVHANEVVQ